MEGMIQAGPFTEWDERDERFTRYKLALQAAVDGGLDELLTAAALHPAGEAGVRRDMQAFTHIRNHLSKLVDEPKQQKKVDKAQEAVDAIQAQISELESQLDDALAKLEAEKQVVSAGQMAQRRLTSVVGIHSPHVAKMFSQELAKHGYEVK